MSVSSDHFSEPSCQSYIILAIKKFRSGNEINVSWMVLSIVKKFSALLGRREVSLVRRIVSVLFALITARHLGFDHAEPRPGSIFKRLVFCHGPSFSIPPSRASTECNIHEVSLLSRPAILDFHHAEPRSGEIFMRRMADS